MPTVPARHRPPAGDDGVTLVETLVALGLIGVVMAALTAFFVATASTTSRQGGAQSAAQLADDAVELVRSLRGSALASGRDKTSSDTQWSAPVAGAASWLTGMSETWDSAAAYPAGRTAALPTSPTVVTVAGVPYSQSWYVGTCWQPAAGGDCVTGGGTVPFYRVVVAVTWPERHCSGGTCSYLSATLVGSNTKDPVFNANQTAQSPSVTNPGNQTGEVAAAVSLQLSCSGGAPPLTWSGTGLPPGLSIASSGLVTGTPTTAGSWSVTVKTTDGFGLTGTAAFTWTVNALPQLATPANQTWVVGSAGTLTPTLTGGTGPYTWTATGLPAGLSIDSASGTVSGTPTSTRSAQPVTVGVTDSYGKASAATFTWAVNPALQVTRPANQSGEVGVSATSVQVSASGGVTPYSWSASGLPAGLSISSGGQIAGTPTTAATYHPTITVRDGAGGTGSVTITWTVS